MEQLEKSFEALLIESAEIRRRSEDIKDKLDEITERLASLLRDKSSSAADPPPPDLPRFDERDPIGWIARLEEYFLFYKVNEAAKAGIARISLGGAAVHWDDLIVWSLPEVSWKELQYQVLSLCGDVPMGDPFEALLRTVQKGGVEEYISAFKARAVHVEGLCDLQWKIVFIEGLCEDIRAGIRYGDAADVRRHAFGSRSRETALVFFFSILVQLEE